MEEHTPMGMNRTGVQVSPVGAGAMQPGMPDSMKPAAPGDDAALAQARSDYVTDADTIGSVPLPAAVTGAVANSASIATGEAPQGLIDKLGERLAFERIGTRLYDALITKFQALQDNTCSMTMADLQKIRQDEARHFAIIASAIESIGGDPTALTPSADLAGVESSGLLQVVADPRTTVAQSLHAILVAEMTDNAGWELLIVLAEEQGQGTMITDFTVALDEERAHLQQMRRWYEEALFGAPVSDGAVVDDIADTGSLPPVH